MKFNLRMALIAIAITLSVMCFFGWIMLMCLREFGVSILLGFGMPVLLGVAIGLADGN